MADRKDRMALLSRYSKLYLHKYGQRPNMNLNAEQWSADALIESYGLPSCYDILEYYFNVSQNPSWNHFAYNAQSVLDGKLETEQDKEERRKRRELAKRWLSE